MKAYKALEIQQNNLIKALKVIWRQISKTVWLRKGEWNTKFFHGKTYQRGETSSIKKLTYDNEIWWRGDSHRERLLINYFSKIFSISSLTNIKNVCEVIQGKLNNEHKTWSEANYLEHEM